MSGINGAGWVMADNELWSRGVFPARYIERLREGGGIVAPDFDADQVQPASLDLRLGDVAYRTGRHTAPLFAGDTVFAATEVLARRDHPQRRDLGLVDTRLLGHKFERAPGAAHADAPPGWKRTRIFELEREIAVKRRSHYRRG